jgi:flagellar biogenesis protein FliO
MSKLKRLTSCARIAARTLDVDDTTMGSSAVVVVIGVAVTVVVVGVGERVGLLSWLRRLGSSDPSSSRAGPSGRTSAGRSLARV